MKVELENILDIGTELYSLDENFKIKRKDDAALGIPLIEPEDERDYVDWNAVRNLLIARNII